MVSKRDILSLFWLVFLPFSVVGQSSMPGVSTGKTAFGQEVLEVTATDTDTVKKQKEFLEEYYESATERISQQYKSGMYLIYDCQGRFYVCVNQESFEYCQEKRKRSREKKHKFLDCAPLKKYETTPSCLEALYKVIHSPIDKVFCLVQKINEVTASETLKKSTPAVPATLK